MSLSTAGWIRVQLLNPVFGDNKRLYASRCFPKTFCLKTPSSYPGVAQLLPWRGEVKLSLREQFLQAGPIRLAHVFNDLRMAAFLLYSKPDEVARNGVLQRITSARGFL